MTDLIDLMLTRCGGAVSWDLLARAGVARADLDSEIRRKAVVSLYPRAYCRPWDTEQIEIRELAALMSVGHPAALSHLTALRRWGLVAPPRRIHLTVPARRCVRPSDELVVHRAERFPPVTRVDRQLIVLPAQAVATSWTLLDPEDRREPAITAVRQRLATPGQLREAIALHPRLPGRQELVRLVDLLEAGCESELEIWGHLHVFDVPGLDHATPQKWVKAQGRWFRLDRAYEAERVGIELDGRRYHDRDEGQRERDRARDSALGSIDWLTLRFSHRRLHRDIGGCRRETLDTLAARGARRTVPG